MIKHFGLLSLILCLGDGSGISSGLQVNQLLTNEAFRSSFLSPPPTCNARQPVRSSTADRATAVAINSFFMGSFAFCMLCCVLCGQFRYQRKYRRKAEGGN
jgi:hypothetical protein